MDSKNKQKLKKKNIDEIISKFNKIKNTVINLKRVIHYSLFFNYKFINIEQ